MVWRSHGSTELTTNGREDVLTKYGRADVFTTNSREDVLTAINQEEVLTSPLILSPSKDHGLAQSWFDGAHQVRTQDELTTNGY
jgi:hypothetical protein